MLFSFCAISLIVFILSSYLGHTFFFKLVGNDITHDKFATLFLSCLLGFLFIVCGYAVATKGIYTILSLPFVILLITSFFSFSPKVLPFSKEIIYTLTLLCGWTLYFDYTINVSQDALFYSLMAKSLPILPENYFLANNLLSASFRGTTSYHYGEMWATSLLLCFLKYDAVEVIAHIVYPFLSFLCFLGMTASSSSSLTIIRRIGHATVLVFATAAFYSLKPNSFIHSLNLYLFNITSEVFFKMLFIFPLSIACALWLKRRVEIAFLILFQLPLFSFVLFPAVYGGSFLALLILMQRQILPIRMVFILNFLLIVHVIFIVTFYILTPSTHLSGWTFTHLLNLYSSNSSYSLITFRNILIGQPLFIFLSFLPCIGLFFLFKPLKSTFKEHQIHLILAGSITLSGIFAFALLFPVRDSIQLAQVAWIAVSFILFLTVLAAKPALKSSYLTALASFTIVFIGFSIYSTDNYRSPYSSEFIARINDSLKERPLLKIGSIRKESSLESYFMYLQPILPFKELPNFLGCIPMTRPRPLLTDSLTKFRALDIEQESAFYEYLTKKNGKIWTLESTKWEDNFCTYTDSVHLDAILVEQGAPIPFCLRQNTKQTLVVDPLSGEQLFVLN